jgi:hypothetical protein
MTEGDWNSAPIADLLLHTLDIHRTRYGAEPKKSFRLQGPLSALRVDLARKHMLLAYGILRRYWGCLDPAIQQAIETLEALEETPGKTPDPPLNDFDYVTDLFLDPLYRSSSDSETCMAMWLVGGWWPEVKSIWAAEELPESWRRLFHDIFGNPFRPLPNLDPSWLHWHEGIIPKLAQWIYDSGDFANMPSLADALEVAGCTNQDILVHCRGSGPHVRGCWVVDLLLGKE